MRTRVRLRGKRCGIHSDRDSYDGDENSGSPEHRRIMRAAERHRQHVTPTSQLEGWLTPNLRPPPPIPFPQIGQRAAPRSRSAEHRSRQVPSATAGCRSGMAAPRITRHTPRSNRHRRENVPSFDSPATRSSPFRGQAQAEPFERRPRQTTISIPCRSEIKDQNGHPQIQNDVERRSCDHDREIPRLPWTCVFYRTGDGGYRELPSTT